MTASLGWALALFLFAIVLLLITWIMKGLVDKVVVLLENINEKITSLEGEVKPILQDVERTLSNVEPLTKELGERNEEVGNLLRNIEKVTDDIQATTGAIRTGIVPIAHTVTSLFAGLKQGVQVIDEYRSTGSTDYETNGGEE
jgi:peptidoglycan hydrolase CwlO-like protein